LKYLSAAIAFVACAVISHDSHSASSAAIPPISIVDSGWKLQDVAKITDTGSAISSANYKPQKWYNATVPGTVLTSLVNDGVYPEPLYGENNRPDKVPDSLCRTSYWYRTTFTVPASYAGRSVQLNFEGINYFAEVWLNGHDMGPIKGAFSRGIFDITSSIHSASANALAVNILPPPDPGIPEEQTVAAGTGHNGGILAEDGPTFLCTIGWDWIPGIRDRDMGIWQKVFLSAHGPVTIHDPDVTTDLMLPRLDSADLTIKANIANDLARPQSGVLVGTFGGAGFRYPVTLAPSESRDLTLTPQNIPVLHILHPKLWWPNGYGPQNLYRLTLRFEINGADSDSQSLNFGVRKVTYAVPGSDNLTISVNGVPVLCKGGDWGMDEAMKREPYKRLDAQIRMHQQANYTIIRNWVGQSTSDDFYDLCDKYGIMLWDEMFQPNPSDGPNPIDNDLYLANVREKITRYRSHPCIALWCGRNEGYPPPNIDSAIRKIAAELDPDRLYQPSSTEGRGVHSSGPYYWRAPRIFYNVDAPFKTEIGSVSVPTLESVEAMLPKKDWNTVNDDWAEHDMCRGAQAGDQYPREIASRYGPISNLADFDRKSQLANYEAFRAMYEGREAKLFQPVTGVITWMSNPAQPSFVWQLYAWDLEPNASLFATRKACEPIHIMLNQSNWHVQIINNTPDALTNISARVSIYNLDGTLKSAHTDTLTAAPSAATDDGEVIFPDDVSAVHFVKLELRDTQEKLLSDNFYWRETKTDDFTALNTMKTVALTAHEEHHAAGANELLTVTLKNQTQTPAVMAHIQLRNNKTNKRVLPVYYSDNYISLLPGEIKTIQIEAAKSDFDGGKPLILVDGWNATVNRSADILPNTDALNVAAAKTIPIITDTLRIDCGGGGTGAAGFYTFGTQNPPPQGFAADIDYSAGNASGYNAPINTDTANSAPQSVYRSERWGPSTYTIPILPGKTYTVRLHMAENTFNAVGAREFNVDINGTRQLTNFDIFATAGGKQIAVVKDITGVHPDASGNIVINLSIGAADQPSICGIEVFPS
jgi:beta-galactosidase/beta-glucuronidase